MSVRRFRSIEEMKRPLWREPGDPRLFEAIRRVWSFGQRTGVRRFPPGVYKHASIEGLNRLTEEWARANFEMLHARGRLR